MTPAYDGVHPELRARLGRETAEQAALPGASGCSFENEAR